MFTDCQGVPYPVFAKGEVTDCAFVVGAIPFGSVSLLKVRLEAGCQEPAAGQFYMLHAIRSDVLLGRPISIYHSEKKADGSVELSFLILLKGKGTRENQSDWPMRKPLPASGRSKWQSPHHRRRNRRCSCCRLCRNSS